MKRNIWYSLVVVLVVATTVLAACAPAATTAPADTAVPAEDTAVPADAPEPAGSTQVEVFSWWVGGGEAAGLTAMTKVFAEQYPDIEFVNAAVAGGSGTNARAVLATRLQAGDAPDSWQAHAGQEIIGTYVAADQIAPLDDFFAQSGFSAVLPRTSSPADFERWTSLQRPG